MARARLPALAAAVAVLLLPPVRELLFGSGYRWLYVLLLSASVSALLTPAMRWASHRLGVLDLPDAEDRRKIHDQPTPLLGGLAVYAGVVGALVANGVWPPGLPYVLAAATGLMVFSLVDDLRPIGSWAKFSVFLMSAALAVAAGARATVFHDAGWGGAANVVVSFIWILGIFNALNFLDGMDGLAAGLAAVIALFSGLVAYDTGQPSLGWVSAAIVGSCAGFLPYNYRPGRRATIFLGDAGSNFLGFTLASVALLGYWADADPLVAISSPLLIFGVLIYDMGHITVSRIAAGKVRSFYDWIHYTGRDHLHHRLLPVLGSRHRTVAGILILSVALGLGALALRRTDVEGAVVLLSQALLVLILVTMVQRRGRRREG